MSDMRVLTLIALLAFLLTPGAAAVPGSFGTLQAEESGVSHWVSGYYVAYQRDLLPPGKIEWSGMTHLIFGRVTANPDGTINQDFDIGAPDGPALARKVARLAHAHNKTAVLMLGGAGSGEGIYLAVRDHRAEFISNLVGVMETYGYDGLDLDWEDEVDWDLFVTFAKELREKAPDAVLTMPVGAINSNYQTVIPQTVLIARYLDQVNLMTYYPGTAWAGSGWHSWFNSPLKGAKPTTPVSIADSLARYSAAGIPKRKLGMGIGFYAIGYSGGITGPDQPTTEGCIRGGDNDYPLSMLYGKNGEYNERFRRWDQAALEPYLSLPKPDLFGCRYVSFEDEQSILSKGAFTRAKGYGGIIIWTINQGYVGSHSDPSFLMKALRKGFIAPDEPGTVAVSVYPRNVSIHSGQSVRFRALVTGAPNRNVSWTVQETSGGSINPQGVYSSPSGLPPGSSKVFHVIARSRADRTKYSRAAINVRP
ncbi:MAG: glycoside hydrolase family 18 protein [Methanoregulaceae archaeon]|nr:glycoside hydrolase family 18 protein [Methanoregulaceae archaeon]